MFYVVQGRDRTERKRQFEALIAEMGRIAGTNGHASHLHCRMERGAPGNRILEQVRENPVDLIVLSSGGSSGSQGSPIGSVTDQILTEAPCPVWLEWRSARNREATGMSARKVSCVLELNDSDDSVLGQAADIALELGARLRVIHALYPALGKPLTVLWSPGAREHARQLAEERIAALCKRVFPSAEIVVDVGSSHTVITRALSREETGLLVTGNARAAILAAESACPVLRLPTHASVGSRLELRYAGAGA